MALMNTEIIDNINNQIEGVLITADNVCDVINEQIAEKQGQAQEFINDKIDELGEMISTKGNEMRDKTVEIFSAQYQSALEAIKPIEPLLNISLSLDTVVSAVKTIIEIITKPYQPIIEFTTILIPKVLELSANLQKLASYQPNINLPEGVSIPPLKVNIKPITAADIMGGGE